MRIDCNFRGVIMKKYIDIIITLVIAIVLMFSVHSFYSYMLNNYEFSEAGIFSEADKDSSYNEATIKQIKTNNEDIIIDKGGSYLISGNLVDKQIIVDVDKEENVYLVLDTLTITNELISPIEIKGGKHVYVTLVGNSINQLSVNQEVPVIASEIAISFNGNGNLELISLGDGIKGEESIVIAGGNYNLVSAKHGINAKENIRLTNSKLSINSGKDGIKATSKQEDAGYIYIEDGHFDINAKQDGIDAEGEIIIIDGDFKVVSGEGFQGILTYLNEKDEKTTSKKALKGSNITINGGAYQLEAFEDGIHANKNLIINAGKFEMSVGAKGLFAKDDLIIDEVELIVNEAYEGIEANKLVINDGKIIINTFDDAINALELVTINDGDIFLKAKADGIDSNGDLILNGGAVIINKLSRYNQGDAMLDIAGEFIINGGIITDENGILITIDDITS